MWENEVVGSGKGGGGTCNIQHRKTENSYSSVGSHELTTYTCATVTTSE